MEREPRTDDQQHDEIPDKPTDEAAGSVEYPGKHPEIDREEEAPKVQDDRVPRSGREPSGRPGAQGTG